MRRRRLLIGLGALVAVLVAADWLVGGISQRLLFGTATLDVTSQPSGATLLVDGVRRGATPTTITVAPGDVVIKLSHRFHADHVERLTVQRGEVRTVAATFAPATGSLVVVTNPKGAAVEVDGVVAGHTPLTLAAIATGAHELRMTIPGRAAVVRSVDVMPGAKSEVNVDLERLAMGTLILQTTPPDAEVEFVDRALTYRSGIELPVGVYALRVSKRGFVPQSITVNVGVGRSVHSVTLDQQFAPLVLRVTPANARVRVRHGTGRLARTEDYAPDMILAVGTLELTARAPGHRRYTKTVQLGASGIDMAIALTRIDARAGDRIRDNLRIGGEGPEMIVVGAGSFLQGARRVTFEEPFAIGVYEVTRAQYRAFADATGRYFPDAKEHETDLHPIASVDRDDALAYARWLSAQSGQVYRLPNEREWDYMAQTDASISVCAYGNVADASAEKRYRGWDTVPCDDGHIDSAPVGSFRPNANGVYDVIGNVSEWVSGCWVADDAGSRIETDSDSAADCVSDIVKGGSWDTSVDDAHRSGREPASTAADDRGFRVLREF